MVEASIERGRFSLRRNTAEFIPRLGLLGSLEYTDEWAEYPGFEEKNPSWSLGARVELPLFLGGGRSRERRALKTELGALQFERDEAALKAANGVRVEAAAWLSKAVAFPPAAYAAERAQEYMDLVLADYSVGKRPISDLLDAVDNARRTGHAAITAQIDYFRTTARLLRLTGISAQERANTPGSELISRLAQPESTGP